MSTEELHKRAVQAQARAHAPYSGYKIGAALQLTNGQTSQGANIENASYGATVCAERVAIWTALHENPGGRIQDLVVVSDAAEAWPPCGLCRQVIAEFAGPETRIHVGNLQGLQKTYRFSELFPAAFLPSHLEK